jgi:hypothetical protein
MKEKETKWLSGYGSRIEPPPKRTWYGEETEYEKLCRAVEYNKHYKRVRREIDKHYNDVTLAICIIATFAWCLAFVIVALSLKIVWPVIPGVILAPFFGVISQCAILELLARWKASLRLRSNRKEKFTFKQTFKFGNQNGSK